MTYNKLIRSVFFFNVILHSMAAYNCVFQSVLYQEDHYYSIMDCHVNVTSFPYQFQLEFPFEPTTIDVVQRSKMSMTFQSNGSTLEFLVRDSEAYTLNFIIKILYSCKNCGVPLWGLKSENSPPEEETTVEVLGEALLQTPIILLKVKVKSNGLTRHQHCWIQFKEPFINHSNAFIEPSRLNEAERCSSKGCQIPTTMLDGKEHLLNIRLVGIQTKPPYTFYCERPI